MELDFATIRDNCIAAIDEEIKAVLTRLRHWGGDQPVEVSQGELDGTDGEYAVYRVTVNRNIIPPENVGLEVQYGGEYVRGYVDSVEDERTFYIALEKGLDTTDPRGAIISFDATNILRAMQDRLKSIKGTNDCSENPVLNRLLNLEPIHTNVLAANHPALTKRGLNESQRTAAQKAAGSDLCMVFGPPGTGKTRTLGATVALLADTLGKRVLVTAHTNTALDKAMAEVVEALPAHWVEEGKIVRSGKMTKAYERLGIGRNDVAQRLAQRKLPELKKQKERLEQWADQILPPARMRVGLHLLRRGPNARKKSDISAWMTQIEERLLLLPKNERQQEDVVSFVREFEAFKRHFAILNNEIEKSAQVVGATLSKLALEPKAFGMFDSVVIDEGSMAMLPQAMIAALHSKGQLIVFGDPCQLNPVVQSRSPMAKAWLRRNVYRHLEADSPESLKPFVAMLEEQYRMRPEIRSFISKTFYANRLRDAANILQATHNGPAMIFYDTSEIGATSERSGQSSRVNPVHAGQVALMIRELQETGHQDIAVVTPYADQAKLIRASMRELGIRSYGVQVGTVHRMQGGERDTVIVDLTDAPPEMGAFLDESWNDELPNLLCVALSRARHRLILMAHARGFRAKYGYSGAFIMRVLEHAAREAMANNAYVRHEGEPPMRSLLPPAIHDILTHRPKALRNTLARLA